MVLDRMINAIGYAKEQGMHVVFFGIDATRTSPEFLQQVYTAAVNDAHADEVVLVDTLGIAAPQGIRTMVKMLKSWISVPIGVHCHEDMSNGVACSLAAFQEGADEVHVTVNGLGERTGNVDMASLAMASKILYGADCTVDYSMLCELSRCVEKHSGIPVPGNKPVVGPNIFIRESGLVVAQMMEYPPAVEPFDPAMVGARRGVSLGKNSGLASIEYKLLEHHLEVAEESRKEILARVKALGVKKETSLTEDEFLQIAREYRV
jgi:isopropylmalate/homocitrate/citramalate synthase